MHGGIRAGLTAATPGHRHRRGLDPDPARASLDPAADVPRIVTANAGANKLPG
ncbi:hypothetical protein [Dactylosporangium sp. NPDC048998]|uniref:hypothetical protein n=1 Tax=Dactylosporangium sp. NPDC048998 TaxID=3363976 RepID=UPI0037201F4F